jgi:hypothetical protein
MGDEARREVAELHLRSTTCCASRWMRVSRSCQPGQPTVAMHAS